MSRKKAYFVIEAKTYEKIRWTRTLLSPKVREGQAPTEAEVTEARRFSVRS